MVGTPKFVSRLAARAILTGGLVALFSFSLLVMVSCQTPAEPPSPESSPPAGGSGTEKTPEEAVIEVTIAGFAFQPTNITIPAGATVTWTNQDATPHTVTSRDNLFDSGTLSRNGTFSYTFSDSGTFEYYCAIHSSMTGSVIVQ